MIIYDSNLKIFDHSILKNELEPLILLEITFSMFVLKKNKNNKNQILYS